MKKIISLMLSLLLVMGTCLSMAVSSSAAEKKYELPGKLKGHSESTDDLNDEVNHTVNNWSASLAYNKSSKTLTCTCEEADDCTGLMQYLYSLSTDKMSNRFFDQYDTATMFVEEYNLNLFSVDPIRFGKIKEIDIKEKDGNKISPVEKYTFETKNNKVVGNAYYILNTRGQLWARVKNSFSYNKNGLISKIVMTCRDPDLHFKVESTYSYDSQNRPLSCTWKQIDTETEKVDRTVKIDYSDFNNAGWPLSTKITEMDNPQETSDGDRGVYEFDSKGRMMKDFWWEYTYDSQGRLTKLYEPTSNTQYPNDGATVTFSSFFTI